MNEACMKYLHTYEQFFFTHIWTILFYTHMNNSFLHTYEQFASHTWMRLVCNIFTYLRAVISTFGVVLHMCEWDYTQYTHMNEPRHIYEWVVYGEFLLVDVRPYPSLQHTGTHWNSLQHTECEPKADSCSLSLKQHNETHPATYTATHTATHVRLWQIYMWLISIYIRIHMFVLIQMRTIHIWQTTWLIHIFRHLGSLYMSIQQLVYIYRLIHMHILIQTWVLQIWRIHMTNPHTSALGVVVNVIAAVDIYIDESTCIY